MIFVVDKDGNVGSGDTFMEAVKDYDISHGDYHMSELKVFTGIEMEVDYVVKPKKKEGDN